MANGSGRPLSPHLQVYKFEWTMALSITHRITGVGLAVGTLLLTWWLVAAAAGPESFARAQKFIGSGLGLLLMFGWTWALFYHLANGIRHLVWDAGYSFELKNAEKGAYIVAGASLGLTILAWIIGLAVW
ncbi:succinate dehydrogenase, cytochrome b556 subunit [Azospirillum sp. sgz302134]